MSYVDRNIPRLWEPINETSPFHLWLNGILSQHRGFLFTIALPMIYMILHGLLPGSLPQSSSSMLSLPPPLFARVVAVAFFPYCSTSEAFSLSLLKRPFHTWGGHCPEVRESIGQWKALGFLSTGGLLTAEDWGEPAWLRTLVLLCSSHSNRCRLLSLMGSHFYYP